MVKASPFLLGADLEVLLANVVLKDVQNRPDRTMIVDLEGAVTVEINSRLLRSA